MAEEIVQAAQKPGAGYYVARFVAAFIDILICFFLFYVLGMIVAAKTGAEMTSWGFNLQGGTAFILFGLAALVGFAYFWLMEGIFGRTIGKMICNLKVVREGGASCGLAASAIRNLLRVVDYFFFYLVGIITILVTKKQQRVGDLAAKTFVVHARSGGIQGAGIALAIVLSVGSILVAHQIGVKHLSSVTSAPGLTTPPPVSPSTPTTLNIPPPQTGTVSPGGLAIQNLRFTEGKDGPPSNKAYEPGSDIFLAFDLMEVPLDASGSANTIIKFEAFDPNGKLLLEPTVIDLKGPPPPGVKSAPVNYHLTLPSYVIGGQFPLQITVQDNVSGKGVTQRLAYAVNGPSQIPAVATLTASDYYFVGPDGKNPQPDATYNPGAEIKSRFKVLGFKLGPQNEIKLRLDMAVESSSGDKLLDQPNIVNASDTFFYPPSYLPLSTSVTTPAGIPPGKYIIHYILYDDVAGTQAKFDQSFNIKG